MPIVTQSSTGPTAASGWLNSTRIFVNDGSYATFNLTHGQISSPLLASGFNFSIPSFAVILGISALIIHGDMSGGGSLNDNLVQLLKAGVGVGNNEASGIGWGAPPETFNYGGVGDLWGTTWTPADINNAGFGIQLTAKDFDPSISEIAGVDFVNMSVTFSVGPFMSIVTTE